MIVVSPTDDWFRNSLADCSRSLSISSPYIGSYLSKNVAALPQNISVTLLTRTLLTDFASKASDLEAVKTVAERAGGVLSLSSLHAKVYVIDNKFALITSANATASGMFRNRECRFELRNAKQIRDLLAFIEAGFGSRPRPERWTVEDLEALREPVEKLRAALPKITRLQPQAIEAPPRVELRRRDFSRLVESFSGWLRLTMEGVSQINANVFTMDDVLAVCASLAASQFPGNRHVREKLRQQMQRLRDLGLVLFLGNGRYELLAKPS